MSRSPLTLGLQAAPLTFGIAAAAVLASAHWFSGNPIAPLILASSGDAWQPWRYLTTTLPHDNALQLAFNVILFMHFGLMLERTLGSLRFFGLFAIIAAGSSAAEFALAWGALGLSGVLYGLFGTLWILSRRDERFCGAVGPIIKTLLIGLFFLYVLATIAGTHQASNFANATGAALGGLLGLVISAKEATRARFAAMLTGCSLLLIAGAVVARPHINLSPAPQWELASAALDAAIEGDYETAIDLHRRLLGADPLNAELWFNLGRALCETAQYGEGIDALGRAVELDPHDEGFRSHIARCRALSRGEEALRAFYHDEFNRSAALYHEAIAFDAELPHLWNGLGHALSATGRYEEAARAFRHALDLDPLDERHRKAAAWTEARHLAQLGRQRFLAEDYQRSSILYRQALRADETVPEWWFNLALALAHQLDEEGGAGARGFVEARRAAARALELDPNHDQAAELLRWLDDAADANR